MVLPLVLVAAGKLKVPSPASWPGSQEIVRGGFVERVHIGLDYFDASINRVAAWVIGARATLRALLAALLEPQAEMRALEQALAV